MIKIVISTILCGIICFYLRNTNKDFFPLAILTCSIILIVEILSYLTETISLFQEIISFGKIETSALKIILKITGIGLVVEFGAGLLNDLEITSLSDKLVLLGKIFIILSSIPIFYTLLSIIKNLLEI